MRTSLTLVLVACALLTLDCSRLEPRPEVRSGKKTISDEPGLRYRFARGRWKITGKPSTILPTLNSVDVLCSKDQGTCTETIAMLVDKGDSAGLLWAMNTEFKIVEWTATLVRAVAETRVADLELRISIPDESAERTVGETRARGVASSDAANVARWMLE